MQLLVDASVLLAVIADEPERPQLVAITAGHDLAAPRSIHWEIGNALSAMLKRKRIDLDWALQALRLYAQIPITFLDVDLDRSLRLAAQYNLYAYDAYIIASAMESALPLISLDRKLRQAAGKAGVETIEVMP